GFFVASSCSDDSSNTAMYGKAGTGASFPVSGAVGCMAAVSLSSPAEASSLDSFRQAEAAMAMLKQATISRCIFSVFILDMFRSALGRRHCHGQDFSIEEPVPCKCKMSNVFSHGRRCHW